MKKTKIAIGCIVQWYEVEMHTEYVQSVINAIDYYDKNEVIVDLCFYLSQNMERVDANQITSEELLNKFKSTEQLLIDNNINYNINYHTEDKIYTIADYRREFNENYCDKVEVLMWGESDALIPQQAFSVLNSLHLQVKEKTPKYISFFGSCKMWDDSWKVLEHPDFTDKEYMSGPEHTDKWWSTWYTTSIEEMNAINDKTEDLQIVIPPRHKVNGCGLVVSSEVIKAGVNIPRSIMLVHEDTAFMNMTNKLLGNVPQYILKNLLLVHNRHHPRKRMYVLDENVNMNSSEKRESRNWYKRIFDMDNINCSKLFTQHTAFTWDDVKLNEE